MFYQNGEDVYPIGERMARLKILLWGFCGLALSSVASETCEEKSFSSQRVSARYMTPRGIGYKNGYTTVEVFFTGVYDAQWMPFLDLRGHIFDNGKFAANAGLGFRYLTCSRTYGMNAYYDYRNTSHRHYNQVALGLETLGKVWDARVNGYLPIGDKQSPFYHPEFKGFQGNYLYTTAKREFAMKGANAEVGLHVESYKPIPLYFALGPYYLTGSGASTWGGQLRARADFFDEILRIEANTSYDHFFHWIGQGQISLSYAFGKRKEKKCSCPKGKSFYTRSLQKVDRFEIIPTGKERVSGPAIDPENGSPFLFVFVDNTSSSLGTFESPYPTLAEAEANSFPGQILYVFPGDGTSTGMNAGVTLKNSQMLVGASVPLTINTSWGPITIPPLASSPPVITNLAAAPVVTLANNNFLSGLYLENNTGTGVSGAGISNFTFNENTMVGGAAAQGMLLDNISGLLTVNNNLFVQTGPSSATNYAISIQNSLGSFDATFEGDAFYLQPNGNNVSGIYIDLTNQASLGNLVMADNSFSSTSSTGIAMEVTAENQSSFKSITLSNTSIDNCSIGLEVDVFGQSTGGVVLVENTQLSQIGYAGIYADMEDAASLESLTIRNSSIATSGTYGVVTYQGTAGTLGALTVANCQISGCEYGINPELGGSGALDNFIVSQCDLSQNTSGIEMDLQSTGSINNCSISRSAFNDNAGMAINLSFAPSTSMGNMSVLNNSINASEYGILSNLDGTIDTLTIEGCNFSNNQFAISLQNQATPVLNIVGNTFSGNQSAISSNAIPATQSGNIQGNQFIGSFNQALNLTTLSGSTNAFSVTDNQFTGISGIVTSPIQGYAAAVTTSAGSSLCLEFAGNTATPTMSGSYVPYLFDATSGTFNLTSDTTQANNVGTITETGTFGVCSP